MSLRLTELEVSGFIYSAKTWALPLCHTSSQEYITEQNTVPALMIQGKEDRQIYNMMLGSDECY